MPALEVDDKGVPAVSAFASLLNDLLDEASVAKQTATIEPALNKSDFDDLSHRVSSALPDVGETQPNDGGPDRDPSKTRRNAIVETAARDLFCKLIVSTALPYSPDSGSLV